MSTSGISLAGASFLTPDKLGRNDPPGGAQVASARSPHALLLQLAWLTRPPFTHDRYMLDSTVSHIASVAEGELRLFRGNYSAYVTDRELRRLAQQRKHAAQQKEIARIEASIKRFELWASMVVNERHIKQARSRRKRIERMEQSGELVGALRELLA